MRNSNEVTLKQAIEELLKTYRLDNKLLEVKLLTSWERQMGPMISRLTREIYINNKVLYVKLDSSVLREELSYGKQKIVDMLNKAAGKVVIEDVIFS